jgi:hypothetical protein
MTPPSLGDTSDCSFELRLCTSGSDHPKEGALAQAEEASLTEAQ